MNKVLEWKRKPANGPNTNRNIIYDNDSISDQ